MAVEDVAVGPLDRTNRVRCFRVRLIDNNICGDDSGRYFDILLSTHDDHVIPAPYIARVYIFDAVECSKLSFSFTHSLIHSLSLTHTHTDTHTHTLSLSLSPVVVRIGLIVTTSRVREDELSAATCASVYSPPVLERDIAAIITSRSGSAGQRYLPIL